MRIYFETDLEGATGVWCEESAGRDGGALFTEAYANLAADINAAIEGAAEGGADAFAVTDGHGAQGMDWSLLDPRAERRRCNAFDGCDAVFVVGQHAMAGTMNAFLDHTQSSRDWFCYKINGRPTGEIGQTAMCAAAAGLPVIFLSGDEAAVTEAHNFLGNIETAAVKRGIGRQVCALYDPAQARAAIRAGAKRAVERFLSDPGQFRLYTPALPAVCELTFTRTDRCDAYVENGGRAERTDARTIRWIAGDYLGIFPW